MIRKMGPVILFTMMSLGFLPGLVAAKPSDMRAAYEDGWKWYLHRKAAGAPDGELVGILHTLKRKYGFTYFNLERVDRAIEELEGKRVNLPFDDPFPEHQAVNRVNEQAAKPEAAKPKPQVPEARPAAASAAEDNENGDPFDRYMASQRAILKSDPDFKETGAITKAAPQVASNQSPNAPFQAVSPAAVSNSAVLLNQMAQNKINELSSPDEMVKVKAARSLGDMREPGAIGPLIKLLAGDSTFVSMAASNALAKIGAPAVKPLLGALQDPNPNVRIGACVALADMHDPAIEPALQKASQDQDTRVRRAAATALTKNKPAK